MNSGSYSREELQNLPQKLKKESINNVISSFAQSVYQAASIGKTSYLYQLKNENKNSFDHQREMQMRAAGQYIPVPPTKDELIQGCKERFSGCSISYKETWVEKKNDTKQLEKGILIDWS
jgi:hypothetical protein